MRGNLAILAANRYFEHNVENKLKTRKKGFCLAHC